MGGDGLGGLDLEGFLQNRSIGLFQGKEDPNYTVSSDMGPLSGSACLWEHLRSEFREFSILDREGVGLLLPLKRRLLRGRQAPAHGIVGRTKIHFKGAEPSLASLDSSPSQPLSFDFTVAATLSNPLGRGVPRT